MRTIHRYALLAGSSLYATLSFPAIAQQASAPVDAVSDQLPQQDEAAIIVTANKRSENVQDIPKSVQVVDGGALRQQNIVSVGELQKLVPTIAGEGQTLSLRGVGTGASNINAPNKVGIVVDDIPQPSSTTMSNFLLDVDRIEVLPGPQGTLAGRNATGGLVNMVTRGPSADWTGFVNLLYTSDQQKQASFFLSGPVNDKIQISTSQYFDGFRGLTKNIFLDKWSNQSTFGTRNKIKFLISDSFTADLTAFYQHSKSNGDRVIKPYAFVPNDGNFFFTSDIYRRPFSEQQPGVTATTDNVEFSDPINGSSRTTDYGGIARFTYETAGGVTFTSINSYLNEVGHRAQSFGLGFIPLADLDVRPEYDGFEYKDTKVELYTSEFRINSPSSGPLKYVFGIFYSNETSANDFERYIFTNINNARFKTKSLAAYAHADYEIVPNLTIQGGVRFEKDDISYKWLFPELPAVQKVTSDGVVRSYAASPAGGSSGTDSGNFINYDVGAQYKMTPDVMLYGTFSKAKQGPIYDASDNIGALVGLESLPQESVEALEIGLKSRLFNRMLTLNVSAFTSTYNNYQVQTSVITDAFAIPVGRLASVGKVRTRGVEVNASVRPTSNFRANLNLAYVEAKILDFPNAPCYINQPRNTTECMTVNPGTPQQFRTQGNLAGELLNRAPKLRTTLSFEYSRPINDDGLELYITPLVKYASSQRTDLLRGPTSYLNPTVYVDLSAGVRNDNITFELFVRNLFEENEQTFVPQQAFSPNGALQRVPERINDRYVGARFRYNF